MSLGPNEARFARDLARIADNDPTLTSVRFNDWGIGDEGARRLVVALRGNTVVRSLGLYNNSISAALVTALVGVLENISILVELNLSRNIIGVEGARALTRLFRNNSSLTELYLQDCGVGAEGVRALEEALPRISSLALIDLSGNSIGDVGASAVARLLPGNSTLTGLNLARNEISDVGARSLAEAISSNTSLDFLDLEGNGISDVGARLFAKALLVNSSVTVLDLERNDITILSLWGDDISEALRRLVDDLGQINASAPNPQEALECKIEWLQNLDEGGLSLLGFQERGVEEEVLRLQIMCQVGWLVNSGIDGEKEEAVTLVLDGLGHFMQADQRKRLFEQLLGVPGHGVEVAASMNATRGRALYRYAAHCGAAPMVLTNVIRAHGSLCTCRDVQHKLYPFMLLATMSEAGVDDVMEVLKKDPTIVRSGIGQTVAKNKRKRQSPVC